jgi:hypothetical protein
VLIDTRTNLFDRQWLIDRRCHGLPELSKARHIDHFFFPRLLTPVRMNELLGKVPSDKLPTPVR